MPRDEVMHELDVQINRLEEEKLDLIAKVSELEEELEHERQDRQALEKHLERIVTEVDHVN